MARRHNKDGETSRRLDETARALLRASGSDARVVEEVASSPFLYTRVRARIAAERARREEGEGWLALLGVVWRAAPAMALAAVVAFTLFLFASFGAPSQVAPADESAAFLSAQDVGVEGAVFAGRAMSSEEVLATLVEADYEREEQR